MSFYNASTTVTLSSSTGLTPVIDINTYAGLAIAVDDVDDLDNSIDALAIQASSPDGTYATIYDADGNLLELTLGALSAVPLIRVVPADVFVFSQIKIASVASSVVTAPTGNVTIKLFYADTHLENSWSKDI